MDENYREAFSEVSSILKLMPEELRCKIPDSFKSVIEENKSNRYYKKITEPLTEKNLKPETIVILGMIYKDFLRDKFSNENNINETIQNDVKDYKEINTNELIVIEEKKWYKKIIKLLKNIKEKLC